MTDKKKQPEAAEETALAPQGKAAGLVIQDVSEFKGLLDTALFEHMWRVASLFAASDLVPAHYRGKKENCFIACQMAVRLGVDPFMFMQNTYVVHGRPGMEAKLAIALINTSGLFKDSLQYEIEGEDPFKKPYRVRAYAERASTGTVIYGPWIDWPLVEAEKWHLKEGSKWKTMPAQMFAYRAATFFGRLFCPERLMGMQTAEELEDVGPKFVQNEAEAPRPTSLADATPGRKPVTEMAAPEQIADETPPADDAPKAAESAPEPSKAASSETPDDPPAEEKAEPAATEKATGELEVPTSAEARRLYLADLCMAATKCDEATALGAATTFCMREGVSTRQLDKAQEWSKVEVAIAKGIDWPPFFE